MEYGGQDIYIDYRDEKVYKGYKRNSKAFTCLFCKEIEKAFEI